MGFNSFSIGETVPFTIEVRDAKTRDLVNPSSVKITISNSETLIDGEDMIMDSLGCYHYDWSSNTAGAFKVKYTAVYNGKTVIAKTDINIIP